MWYLTAAILCSTGWFERKLIKVSVVVGFLHMSILRFVYMCVIFKSRKFMDLWFSCVGLSFMLSCIWLRCVLMACGWIILMMHMINKTSTYRVYSTMILYQGAVSCICLRSNAEIFLLLSLKSGIPWNKLHSLNHKFCRYIAVYSFQELWLRQESCLHDSLWQWEQNIRAVQFFFNLTF